MADEASEHEPTLRLGPFLFRATSVTPAEHPDLEEFSGPFEFALWAQRAGPWWIGDLLNSGDDLYGERFSQVCEAFGVSPEMVSRYRSVARRVPAENRRPALSWSAHAAVAGLPHDRQRYLLERAEREGWDSGYLQQVARRERRGEAEPEEDSGEVHPSA